jgi:hypothetical protein
MAIIYDSKGVKKKVILQTYYNLDGDYIIFEDNPLHRAKYENVKVVITKEYIRLTHMNIKVDVIRIDGQEPIECELVDYVEDGDTLIVKLCQDWG